MMWLSAQIDDSLTHTHTGRLIFLSSFRWIASSTRVHKVLLAVCGSHFLLSSYKALTLISTSVTAFYGMGSTDVCQVFLSLLPLQSLCSSVTQFLLTDIVSFPIFLHNDLFILFTLHLTFRGEFLRDSGPQWDSRNRACEHFRGDTVYHPHWCLPSP